MVLLDIMSGPPTARSSLNRFPLAPGINILELIGTGVGNVVSHEIGHLIGNWHTERLFGPPPNIMDFGGDLANNIGIGPDGIFGSADDLEVDFGHDNFAQHEGFTGLEDTLDVISFGMPTPERRHRRRR